MRLDGHTHIIAHVGYPTGSFRAPLIYNPYFTSIGLNAAVVPMGVVVEDAPVALPIIFRMSNVMGALITMPYKVSVVSMLDTASAAVKVAGSCNAVRRNAEGQIEGDMFDGEGFVLGLLNKGKTIAGKRVLIVGSGGVGSAIAASIAARSPAFIGLYDTHSKTAEALGKRLVENFPTLSVHVGSNDPADFDIVVNATPLGMKENDPLPFDVTRLKPETFVGEVVMSRHMTPLLNEAVKRGCSVQTGIDMLFEMIPAYLDFFGFPTTTPDILRAVADPSIPR